MNVCKKWESMCDKLLPTNETYEPPLVRTHAREICAMLAPRVCSDFFDACGVRGHRLHSKVKGLPLDYFLVAGLFEVPVVKTIPVVIA